MEKRALAVVTDSQQRWEDVNESFPGVKDWLLARDIDPDTVTEFGIRSTYSFTERRDVWEIKVITKQAVYDGQQYAVYTFALP